MPLFVEKSGLFSVFAGDKYHFESVVIVKSKYDLLNIDSTKVYILDGVIDMGTQSVEVPSTGISIAGLNGGRDTSILLSTEDNHKMFVDKTGENAGGMVMESMTVQTTGANSQVFDLDNNGSNNALDIVNVNFVACTSLGQLTGYRQLLLELIGFIAIQDGLTFNESWGGFAVIDSIAISLPELTLFKEGTNLTFDGSIRSNMNFLLVDTASVFMDFQENNILPDGGLALQGVRTAATNAMPNISGANVKAKYRNCRGIRNTYVGGQWTITTQATTNIISVNTPVKMAGTTAYVDMQHFSNATDNAFVYDSVEDIEIELRSSFSLSGSNNNQINVIAKKWDNLLGSYTDVSESGAITLNSAGRSENVTLFGYTNLCKDDRIEFWVENQTGSNDVTTLLGGLTAISERAS